MRIATHRSPGSAWYPWSQEWHSTTYQTADPEREALKARDGGDDVSPDVAQLTARRCLALRFMRTSDAGLGRRREKLQRYPVWIAEGDSRAVAGVLDSAVRDAQLIQAR